MKIWCDVCGKEEACVFCSADEAALCNGCDGRVHYANKLASKHLRFSLVNPNYKESPLCDICQERRALLFCQEDRAILCRECDIPIHEANEHTQKHNRFVLTGVKLSPYSSSPYPKTPSSSRNSTLKPNHFSKITNKSSSSSSSSKLKKSPTDQILITSSSSPNNNNSTDHKTFPLSYNYNNNNNNRVDDPQNINIHQQQLNHMSDDGSVSTSSLTEYLMETLPGWQVEDLLDPSSSSNGFCKTFDDLTPYVDDEDFENTMRSFQYEELAIWVPQVSYQNHPFQVDSDHVHAVPQVCTPPVMKKRRNFW